MRLVCCLVLLLGGLQLACAVLVAAWNIQTFGQKKANIKDTNSATAGILNYIAEVVRRYDVIVIQEVRDKSTTLNVINKLMALLNPAGTAPVYGHFVSGRLGPGNHKEIYLYVYNTGTVTHTPGDSFQYPDTAITPIYNEFDRPPFVAKFTAPAVAGRTSFVFVMIPLHAKPHPVKTVAEINALDAVAKAAMARWNTQNILLLGDFNAHGAYLTGGEKDPQLTLTPANGYQWLIHDTVCTNMGQTQCAYDRIVATTTMLNRVARHPVTLVYKAEVFDFRRARNYPAAIQDPKKISDHLPVQVELK